LVLCGIISENTKTITLRILYYLKLAPTHLLMPTSGKADLLLSTPLSGTAIDACALGHHLFKHKLSPYDKKEATLISSRHTSVQAQASTATPNTHPLFMLPFTILELTTQIKKLFPDKSSGPSGITNRMLQAGANSSPSSSSYYSSMAYGNPTCNLLIGNSPSCNQSTKDMIKTKLTLAPTVAKPWPNSLKVSS